MIPGGIYKSHPPADAQKSTVGATPPSHVVLSRNPPDCRVRHMTDRNRRVVPSGDTASVNGTLIVDPKEALAVELLVASDMEPAKV